MEKKKHSQQFLLKRKFLTVLPLLTLPFITMVFWALGGGKGNTATAQNALKQKGLNLKLPEAKLKSDKGLNKLSFYEQAALDSEKIFKERRLDPYWNKYSLSNKKDEENDPFHLNQNRFEAPQAVNEGLKITNDNMDTNERRVYAKLQQLNDQLNKSASKPTAAKFNDLSSLQSLRQNYNASKDIDRLQGMMRAMNQDPGSDTEMQQLNTMLDKILAIQHPETIKDTIRSKGIKQQSNSVRVNDKGANISLMQSGTESNINDTIIHVSLNDQQNDFYSLNDITNNTRNQENAIKAIIPETQTLVAGSTVKLLLSDDITIKGTTIPKSSFIYGISSLNNERLKITVSSIRYRDNILPVSLEVYDLDGLSGIYVPGSISRDVAKQSTNQAVSSIGMTTLDPSLAAQATSAGIQAAKTLISKKVKLVKVTVKAGYQVLLKDNNQKQ
jgi:conjugative transposon TraM protein